MTSKIIRGFRTTPKQDGSGKITIERKPYFGRDALYDADAVFLIFEWDDLNKLIAMCEDAKTADKGRGK